MDAPKRARIAVVDEWARGEESACPGSRAARPPDGASREGSDARPRAKQRAAAAPRSPSPTPAGAVRFSAKRLLALSVVGRVGRTVPPTLARRLLLLLRFPGRPGAEQVAGLTHQTRGKSGAQLLLQALLGHGRTLRHHTSESFGCSLAAPRAVRARELDSNSPAEPTLLARARDPIIRDWTGSGAKRGCQRCASPRLSP